MLPSNDFFRGWNFILIFLESFALNRRHGYRFSAPVRSVDDLGDRDMDRLAVAMALCHSLVKVEGQFVGDSLDVALFQASNWVRPCLRHYCAVYIHYFFEVAQG